MEQYLRVGVICSPHGVKGEAKVFPTTDELTRFTQLRRVYLDTRSGLRETEVEAVRFFKQLAIVKFKGIETPEEMQRLKGTDVLVMREDAVPLAQDEYFLCDIIGARVVTDEDEPLGTIAEVLQTGANDVYVVKTPEGREVLLPVIPDCVLKVDVEAGLVRVHLMKGLID